METTKSIVIGFKGEVGSAIYALEKKTEKETYGIDKEEPLKGDPDVTADVLHICIPGDNIKVLSSVVKEYASKYHAKLIIIHSTVPVGTCRILSAGLSCCIVHSPIRGVHPHLEDGISTFVKYVGGYEPDCKKAIEYMKEWDIKCKRLGEWEATELAKLLSTSYFGWNIAFAEEANKLCDEYGQEYADIYVEWNRSYNEGFPKLDKKEVPRPILYPPKGKIGGHCIISNARILKSKKIWNLLKDFE